MGTPTDIDDFLNDSPDENIMPPTMGDPEYGMVLPHEPFNPKQIIASITKVYQALGGDQWLLEQARNNPNAFLSLIKHVTPKERDGALGTNIQIVINSEPNTSLPEDKNEPREISGIIIDGVNH